MDEPGSTPHPPPLPHDLPQPEDDGAAAHLHGMSIPDVILRSTEGEDVSLARLAAGALVLYVFPGMGRPGEADPVGWKDTPGAYGCTQQSCSFRDLRRRFSDAGYSVAGISTQESEEQLEAAHRLHLAFPLVADPSHRLGNALDLPTFTIGDETFYKRLTIVARNARIDKIFYPVFPPHENAAEVLRWIRTDSG